VRLMSIMDLIDKARELIGGGGIDALAENAGELTDIAQGDGGVLDKAQQAAETLGDGAGEGADAAGDSPGGSEQ
jgi:hypothetical protein